MFLDQMDVAFGHMDGRVEVSLADSTMMWIVQYAMNKAQERMKTKTGVIERLNEISKFYELAVMQLEGCLNIVYAETESSFLESNHAEVLDELREIKDRLQGRLEESELAISEKDRELMELKEREPVSSGASHEIETSTDHNADENDQTRRNKHGKGDLGELRTCMDERMLNIKQRLEPERDMLGEVPRDGIDRKKIEEMGSDIEILKQTMDLAFAKMQSALLLCEMRPKERQWKLTIEKDIMSILIRSFMREFQENVDAQERKKDENQVLKRWQEHWPQMMNEVTVLQHELATLNETCAEDSDCSALSSPTKTSALSSPTKTSALSSPTKASQEEGIHDKPNRSPQKVDEVEDKEEKSQKEGENEDGSNFVAKLIKNHESIIRQKNEEVKWSKHGISQDKKASSSRKRKERLKERIRAVTERLDSLTDKNAQMSEPLFNQRAMRDNKTLSRRNSSEVNEIDAVSKDFGNWGSAWEKEKGVSNSGNEARQEKRALNIEKGYNTMPSSRAEDIHGSAGEGLVQELESRSYCSDIEMLIQQCVYKYYLREVIGQWNECIERNIIERKISDDKYSIFFSEVAKDISTNQGFALTNCQGGEGEDEEHCLQYSKFRNQEDGIENTIKEDICMLMFRKTSEEFNTMMVGCNVGSIVREEIHWIVFEETLKNFANVAGSASREHIENNIQDNFLDQLQFMITESLVKEDVYMVVFKAMVKEWKLELDNYYMENFIMEKIHQVIMVETLSDAILLSMEVKSQVQYNTIADNSRNMVLNQVLKAHGEENLTIILLESLLRCFEAEENLMLSARSEIKEHSKQLDLGSERGDLHEHEIFEDLITGEEQTFSSLTRKVENVLQQLGISKALLIELGTSLGHCLRDSESVHNHVSTNEEEQLDPSVFLPLLNLSQTFSEFEGMVCQRIEIMTLRLDKMKCCLDPVVELFDRLKSKELLYQKAFIKRCQNLQKAEDEVDLLGDQVDALLTLLERIYLTLGRHAPALQQYFEVSNILELIKAELIRGASQSASVVT